MRDIILGFLAGFVFTIFAVAIVQDKIKRDDLKIKCFELEIAKDKCSKIFEETK